MGSPPDSGDELPFSPGTRATEAGLLCGVVLVGLFAVQFERLLGGRAWWYLPVPGAVVGILGAVLNRAHLPSDSPLATVRTVDRRTLAAAVTPLVVLAGGGVLLAVWKLLSADQPGQESPPESPPPSN